MVNLYLVFLILVFKSTEAHLWQRCSVCPKPNQYLCYHHVLYADYDVCSHKLTHCVNYLKTYPSGHRQIMVVEEVHIFPIMLFVRSDEVMCENNCCVAIPVRLVGGKHRGEGRVEVFYSDTWGTVCNDNWDDADAAVVCSMLAMSRDGATPISEIRHFGSGEGRVWMGGVRCNGTEANLGYCLFPGFGNTNCDHSKDAGVICQKEEAETTGPVVPPSTSTSTAPLHWLHVEDEVA